MRNDCRNGERKEIWGSEWSIEKGNDVRCVVRYG